MASRKDFLAASSLFALTPALADAASPAPKQKTSADPELTFDFDKRRFDEILGKQAKHKQCFGATKLSGGDVLAGMTNSLNAYEQFLKEGPGALQAVAVLYHGASIALALSDAVWTQLLVPSLKSAPESIRKDVGTAKPGSGNPYRDEMRALVKRGCSFFVCHNAIAGFSELVAGAVKQTPQQVHERIMAGLLPGALAVPAGVMAVNACQEAKFTYIQSSL